MKRNQRCVRFLLNEGKRRFLVWGLSMAMIPVVLPAMAENSTGSEANSYQSINQVRAVTGTVLDETGEPLIGVSVQVKGTRTGTVTNFDGKFSLNVPTNATLVVSYIGYKTQNVKVGSQKTLTISLKPDNKLLDEVVVVGYGTVKKRDLTGAVSSVSNEMITMTPSSNPMEALQGRVAGLDITKESGQAGEGVNLQLRGNRSFEASGNPLFIIDGMPGDYVSLNPNDIESIEVLKDASSTAVYGSSGSNGVVIITTKQGKAGKVSINFNSYFGFNGWAILPKMNSAEQWVRTRKEAAINGGNLTIDDSDEAIKMEAASKGDVIDWVDAILHTAKTQNYSLSVTGGTEKTKVYFSLNYTQEEGQYTNNDYSLFSSTVRLNQKITDWLSAGMHIQTSYNKKSNGYANNLDNAMRADPFGTLYNEDGTYNVFPLDGADQINILINNDRSVYRNQSNAYKLYLQPYLKISPIKGLTLESRLSANLSYSKSDIFIGRGSYQFYHEAGREAFGDEKNPAYDKYVSASIKNSNSRGYNWENILTYNFKLGEDHEFTLTGVSTYSNSQSNGVTAANKGFSSNTYLWTNLGVPGQENSEVASSYSMGKGMGYVGRLNYSFLGRYLFSASVRYDGSSKLAKDVRWDTFPAFSAGWRISDESFMESTQDWLSNLKIRVGYGETGTAGIGAYSSWSILQQGVMGLGSEQIYSYYYPQTLSNAMLTWERSKNTNIGLDASFLNNRIELNLDWYVTNTDGVIWNQTLPVINGGFNATTPFSIKKNIAETKNTGIEMTLTTRNILKKKFSWKSTFTFATNKEKVTSLGAGASEYITSGNFTLHVGDPVKSYYNYKIDGIWQKDEEAEAAVFGKRPGDLKVYIPNMTRKVNEDGSVVFVKSYPKEAYVDENTGETVIPTKEFDAENKYIPSDLDRVMLGHNSPDWTLGMQNNFTFYDFDLSIYMYTRQGQMMAYDPVMWYNNGGGAFPSHFNYWTEDNPSNEFPALDSTRSWTIDPWATSLKYQDGSFFKIKNVTLGYTMPKNLCSKLGLSKLRLYGTITNPYVKAFNHIMKNYDPEMNGKLNYPLTKQVVFGINLSL